MPRYKVKPFKIEEPKKPRKQTGKTPKPENLTRRIVRGSVQGLTIQGKGVGSWDEWITAMVLDALGHTYKYQLGVFGGRSRPGGNVVDFLVTSVRPEALLDPMGRVWHTGSKEDRFQMEHVAQRKGWKLIAWFTDQYPNYETLFPFLKSKLGDRNKA